MKADDVVTEVTEEQKASTRALLGLASPQMGPLPQSSAKALHPREKG